MTGNRGITSIIEAMARKLSGTVSGFRKHSGYVGRRRGARGFWDHRTKYSGEQLREIRKRKGVGRPLYRLGLSHAFNAWGQKVYPALIASHWGRPSPNLAEWERKQRRGETAEAWRDRIVAGVLA